MGRDAYHRFYEGYTEEKIPGDDGKLHTRRTYRDFYYAPVLTKAQRSLRMIGYPLLFLGGVLLLGLGAVQKAGCNTAWYVALATGLSLVSAVVEAIPLFTCAMGKEKQTVYQFRSGHRTCILWARITAGIMALTALLAVLATLLAGDGAWLPPALFALACGCEALVGVLEDRVAYEKQHNPNA